MKIVKEITLIINLQAINKLAFQSKEVTEVLRCVPPGQRQSESTITKVFVAIEVELGIGFSIE